MSMIYKWLKSNLFGRFQKQCLLCLGPTLNAHLLCIDCEQDLPKNSFHCIICAVPFPSSQGTNTALVCGHCQSKPPIYTTSVISHIYATPIKQLITALKFHNNLSVTPLLAQVFINSLQHRKRNMPECIIPVPLHTNRLRERGFNQALELTRIIAKQLNILIEPSLCRRKKSTPFQSGLSAKQRKQNMKNAFKVSKPHHYKHVAIFDDVVTTGTTVNELAKQLKISGVEIIEVWALARTSNEH